jgi:hypothetical protein
MVLIGFLKISWLKVCFKKSVCSKWPKLVIKKAKASVMVT